MKRKPDSDTKSAPKSKAKVEKQPSKKSSKTSDVETQHDTDDTSESRGMVTRRVMGPTPKTPRTIPRIYCSFARNIERVVINDKTGRSTTRDNGGYRYGVKCEDREAIFYNKKATNVVEAIHYARLKALECALDWFPGLTKVIICDEHGAARTENRASLAPRYIWVANKKATDAGVEVSREQIKPADNLAKSVAHVVNGPQYYTEAAARELGRTPTREVVQQHRKEVADVAAAILGKKQGGTHLTTDEIRAAIEAAMGQVKAPEEIEAESDGMGVDDIPLVGDDADLEHPEQEVRP